MTDEQVAALKKFLSEERDFCWAVMADISAHQDTNIRAHVRMRAYAGLEAALGVGVLLTPQAGEGKSG